MGASSKHFSDAELACKHCHVNGCLPELVGVLEQLRAQLSVERRKDTPVLIDSAYRCSVYNATLRNAAKNSEHVFGIAADVRVEGMTAAELLEFVVRVPGIRGVGRNDFDNYIHVDTRAMPARWCYSANGFQTIWTDPPATPKSMLS